MEEKLFIVNIEDNQNDSELIKEILTNDGISCEIIRVETREEFIAAIEKKRD